MGTKALKKANTRNRVFEFQGQSEDFRRALEADRTPDHWGRRNLTHPVDNATRPLRRRAYDNQGRLGSNHGMCIRECTAMWGDKLC